MRWRVPAGAERGETTCAKIGGDGRSTRLALHGCQCATARFASLICAAVILVALVSVLLGLMNADNPIATMVGSNVWMYIGIGAVAIAIFGIVGWVIGRRG